MKRLVFCFDGTWNRLDAPEPTNVVITAESVTPYSVDGTAQLIFYDEGVGTDKLEAISGGTMGAGMVKNMGEAYRFLIFNYSPGDEIYVFGFSRGAYTARSFVGMLRCCGVPRRCDARKVNDIIKGYQGRKPDQPADCSKMLDFRAEYSPDFWTCENEAAWRKAERPDLAHDEKAQLKVCYVGVWDTVGSLGIPLRYRWWFDPSNRRFGFHDTRLSDFVRSARHALAIDERRVDFAPTLWEGTDELNHAVGAEPESEKAPYQQKWFPGVHGGVGGGGDVRGLSDYALDWIWDGARHLGLKLDSGPTSPAFRLKPDHLAALDNVSPQAAKGNLLSKVIGFLPMKDRAHGPSALHEVSVSAMRRWLEAPENLPERKAYRPPTLDRLAEALNRLKPQDVGMGLEPAALPPHVLHDVVRGDTLGGLARTYLGSATRWKEIWALNRYKILDPDRIYIGQTIRVPIDQPQAAEPAPLEPA